MKKNPSVSNQKRFAPKLHVKKGDQVMVIAGSEKGKKGEVTSVFPDKNRAIVQGVKMMKKHIKPTQDAAKHIKPSASSPQGELKKIEGSIHLSNLMLIDPATGKPTRTGRKFEGQKLVRYSKKSGEIIK